MFWSKTKARLAAVLVRRRQDARDSARDARLKMGGKRDVGPSPRYATVRGPEGHDWDGQQIEILDQSSAHVTTQLGTFFMREGAWVLLPGRELRLENVPPVPKPEGPPRVRLGVWGGPDDPKFLDVYASAPSGKPLE